MAEETEELSFTNEEEESIASLHIGGSDIDEREWYEETTHPSESKLT